MLLRNVAQRQCVGCGRTFRESVAVPFSRLDKFVEMPHEDKNYTLSQNFGNLLHTDVCNFPEHRKLQTVHLLHPCFLASRSLPQLHLPTGHNAILYFVIALYSIFTYYLSCNFNHSAYSTSVN